MPSHELLKENSYKTVKKPWGQEQWISLNDKYCLKKIFINKDQRTSLQYHEQKKETNFVLSGTVLFTISKDNKLENYTLTPGDAVNINPLAIHRFTAISDDVVLLESSTPEVDDVIRIEDDTQRPDGRIENEHE